MRIQRSFRMISQAAGIAAVLLLAVAPLRAATPATGTLSESNPTVTWSGPFLTPTAAGCASDDDSTCDNFKLSIVPPSAAYGPYLVEIHLLPQGDWDLSVWDPSHGNAGGSGNGAGQLETVFLVNPVAGTYTVSAAPYSNLPGTDGNSYTASATLRKDVIVTARQGSEPISFANYHAPAPLGTSAGEPSIGVNWKTGNVFIEAITQTLRVSFNDCYVPAIASWADKSAPTSATSFDPILFTDPRTGRTVVSQLISSAGVVPLPGEGCSLSSVTDDDGETWIPSKGCGTPGGYDHQTVGGGPFHTPLTRDPSLPVYANAVYYCAQEGVTAFCARSDDGGITYGPGVPIYTSCGGLHGHVKVSPADGTVYVPNRNCFNTSTASQAVVVSEDSGLTWSIRPIPFAIPGAHDPSLGIGADGTVYFGYSNGDGRAKVAISRDRGLNWTDVGDVGAPFGILNTSFPVVTAGDADRAAFSFLGTPTGGNFQSAGFDGVWHLYSSHTYDGGQTWTTVDATPNDPVQRGCIWMQGGSNPCRNLLDFMDSTVDKVGRVLVGYADGCVENCIQGTAITRASVATIARQAAGRRLFAAGDSVPPPSACAPLALDDTAVTAENTPVRIAVLANDQDGLSPPLTITGVTQPANGSAAANGDGTITYTPNNNFNTFDKDPDTFTYTVQNAKGLSATANVSVRVTQYCPLAPGARFFDNLDPQTAVYTTSSTRSIGGWSVMTDPTAHSASHAWVVLDDQPGNPTLTQKNDTLTLPSLGISSSSVMNFWHNFDFARFPGPSGVLNVRYESGGVLEISADGGNVWKDLGPYITTGGYNGTVDAAAVCPVAGRRAWVGSSDGDLVAGRADAMKPVSVNLGAAIQALFGATQVPQGLVRFRLGGTYQVLIGGIQGSGWGVDDLEVTNTLVVSSCDHPPIVKDDTANTTTAKPVTIAVLANDFDPDGDPMTVTGVTKPSNGTAVINGTAPNNTVTYTSKTGFTGSDTFSYTVSDGKGATASAKVTVNVSTPPNHPPVAADDSASTSKNRAVTIAVLANDSDPDGDPLTITSVSIPANGTVAATATRVTYTPNKNFLGTDGFTYTVTDGRGGSASARVTVNVVEGANHPPKAMNDTATTTQGRPVTIPVAANDTDADGDTLTASSVTQPSNGMAVTNGNGSVTYSPNSGFTGTDQFHYTVSDGRGGSATARVMVTVQAAAPPPASQAEGNGSISDGNGGRNGFSFLAQSQQGSVGGEVQYASDASGIDLTGTVGVLQMAANAADFSGPCTLGAKKTPCRYAIHTEDNGTPGAGADRFRIQVYNVKGILIHSADGTLVDGDVRFGGN